jgi:hypothetical protein
VSLGSIFPFGVDVFVGVTKGSGGGAIGVGVCVPVAWTGGGAIGVTCGGAIGVTVEVTAVAIAVSSAPPPHAPAKAANAIESADNIVFVFI